MKGLFLISFLLILSWSSFSQSFWKIRTEYGEDVLLTIEFNSSDNTFRAFTRKDAVKDIAGFLAYNVARAAGKLKFAEIVYIEGTTKQRKDSVIMEGMFYYTDKQYAFRAAIGGTRFSGRYYDSKKKTHLLTGVRVPDSKPIKDYKIIINTAFSYADKYLADPSWIKLSKWTEFKNDVNALKPKISDDYELGAALRWYGRSLPYPLFEINKIPAKTDSYVTIEQRIKDLKPGVVLIEGNQLPDNQKSLDTLQRALIRKGAKVLVVDLRGKSKIQHGAAFVFLSYIARGNITPGVFITRKWKDNLHSVPEPPDYKIHFKRLEELGTSAKIFAETGFYWDVNPAKPAFPGKVYALTDHKTSKLSEVLAQVIKTEKLGIIAGQKTAGFPVIMQTIQLPDEFRLIIPVGEFYDRHGKSVFNIGVEPDILTEKPLEYILKIL